MPARRLQIIAPPVAALGGTSAMGPSLIAARPAPPLPQPCRQARNSGCYRHHILLECFGCSSSVSDVPARETFNLEFA
eukprot:scaffold88173_cov13-Tisochrysis_lutea.AAC.1